MKNLCQSVNILQFELELSSAYVLKIVLKNNFGLFESLHITEQLHFPFWSIFFFILEILTILYYAD